MSSLLFVNMLIQINYPRKCKSFKKLSTNETIMFFSFVSIPFIFFSTPRLSRRMKKLGSGEYSEDTCFAQVFYYKLLFNIVMKTKQDNSKRLMSFLLLDFHTSFPFDHKFS